MTTDHDPLGRAYQRWVAMTDRYAAKLSGKAPSLQELKNIAAEVDRSRVAFVEEGKQAIAEGHIDRGTTSELKQGIWRRLLKRAFGRG